MTAPLTGRAALVTGGSRGIGRAIALRLAQDGADVALTFQSSSDKAQQVADTITGLGRKALVIEADAADAAAVTDAVDRTATEFGRLDVLVNSAGIYAQGPIAEVALDDVDTMLAVHVRAPYLASQAALRHLGAGGRIVSIGSNLADRTMGPGTALYSMSKAALSGFTRALAREVGERDITVNLVHPGPTDTDMNPADSDHAEQQRTATALGRFGDADGVADLVAHLAGPSGRNITGTSILVDAGVNA